MTTLQQSAMRKALEYIEGATAGLLAKMDAIEALRTALEQQATLVPQEWTSLLAYALQDDMHNRLTPRVIDIAYTAFTLAKKVNSEDGGASDWFNDTKPTVAKMIAKLRGDLVEEFAAKQALAQQGEQQPVCAGCGIPEGDVHISTCQSGKWPLRVSNGDTAAPAPQPKGLFIDMITEHGPEFVAEIAAIGETAPQPAQSNQVLIDALKLCYEHCRTYHPDVEKNNVGEAVRAALQSAQSVVAQPDHIPDAGEMVPLTDDRVIGLLAEHGCIGAQSKNDFVAGLRYGEAAHGIGVGNTIGK